MIQKIHFENGVVADYLPVEIDGSHCMQVIIEGKEYPIREYPFTEEGCIEYDGEILWMYGSIDLIAGREVKLYWRNDDEYTAAKAAATEMLTEYPDDITEAFGAHEDTIFTLEGDGFILVLPEGKRKYFDTVQALRDFADENF